MTICGIHIDVLIASILATTLRVGTPLTLGALSGLYCERSGVVNIAIEGMMLMGAFCAYVVAVLTGSLWIGILGAIVGAAVLAALHAALSITFKTDQIISGTVINILAIGLTTFLADQYFSRDAPSAGRIQPWAIPGLSDLPVFGRLFVQQPVVWFALALVAITQFRHLLHALGPADARRRRAPARRRYGGRQRLPHALRKRYHRWRDSRAGRLLFYC